MGGKFSIAGTIVGVLIIQTLESSILFLGVSPAQSPVFFAVVVVIVVMIQSPALHRFVRRLALSVRPRGVAEPTSDMEAAG
jgi:simple sugar transport system permease protein